jgi:hypothetical protein
MSVSLLGELGAESSLFALLIQCFRCLFCCCMKDHRGVPNNILCEEEKEMAALYDNKSVAEQNSTGQSDCLPLFRF